MVWVPVTAAKWSTWKCYCDTAGVSIGQAITTLIDWEFVEVEERAVRDCLAF